jgi:hypothetical protein
MVERYLVLDSDPEDDGLRWNLDRALPGLLPDAGFEHRYREGDPNGLQRDVWEGKDTKAILSLVADHKTPSHYVLVEATTEALADQIAEELGSVLPVLSLATLQERAQDGDDPSDLVRMAQGADPVKLDARSAKIIAAKLGDEDALTRYRAAQAAGLAPLPEFLEPLEAMAEGDEESSVRSMAKLAADACRPA